MCTKRIDPSLILAAIVLAADPRAAGSWPARRLDRTCLDCLAESLHDAADLLEGMAERITPPPADG